MRKMIGVAVFSAMLGGAVTYAFAEPQPRMRKALQHLEQSLVQLEGASHDKGGHRAKAMEHVRAAIAEVRAGIAYDNRH